MSKIEWEVTWNPVTGCTKVSPGCEHCYMFRQYPRLRMMGVNGYEAGPDVVTLLPERLDTPIKWKRPRTIFVNSMSDTFHSSVPDYFIDSMFATMIAANQHTFQVLTKRPNRVARWWKGFQERTGRLAGWPWHIWIGTSVESAKFTGRIDRLAKVPAPVRFISAEPLLGPLWLEPWLFCNTCMGSGVISHSLALRLPCPDCSGSGAALEWVIVGGESGPAARPMQPEWARSIRDQCRASGTPFFFKQWGGLQPSTGGRELDGWTWDEVPLDPRYDVGRR